MATQQRYYLVADTNDVLDDVIPLTMNDATPVDWPGYVGSSAENLASDAFTPHFLSPSESMDAQGRHIDYDSWGESGEVNRNSYASMGPVEPGLVEDFQLYGNVAASQRRPEYGIGPVGAYDHIDYTAMQVAQQMAAEAYSEESIVSLLYGGY